MRFEISRAADDGEIRRLLRDNPMPGDISLTLEREPCFDLGASVEGEIGHTIVARETPEGPLAGMGHRSVYRAYVNGRETTIGYLGGLRIDRSYRGRLSILKGGYRALRALHEDDDVCFNLTTIVADNTRARRLLEAGLDDLPLYEPLDELVTLILPVRSLLKRGSAPARAPVRRAGVDDLDALLDCLARNGRRHQLTPVWTRRALSSEVRTRGLALDDFVVAVAHGQIIGCLACWDQRQFKQAVIHHYSPRLRRLRPWLNLLAPWVGAVSLPNPGTNLSLGFFSHLAIDDDAPELLDALISAAAEVAAGHGLELVSLGLSVRSPLLEAIRRTRRVQEYRSVVYLVRWPDLDTDPPQLDPRVMHLEAATL